MSMNNITNPEYAVEFELTIDRDVKFCPYDPEVCAFICENAELWDFIDFSTDFYFDHPGIDSLPSGEYRVYARGIAEFESDRDWETGIEEGHFILGIDKLSIKKINELPDEAA